MLLLTNPLTYITPATTCHMTFSVSTYIVKLPNQPKGDATTAISSNKHPSPVTLFYMETLLLTVPVCSTHVAEDDVAAQAHSDIFQSPAN